MAVTYLDNSNNSVNYTSSPTGVAVQGGSGNDYIVGSNQSDSIHGGAGNDDINGQGGNDYITGGTGADNNMGGSGNDTFIFFKGDLVDPSKTGGAMDHIDDFHGAGGYFAYTGVEDDFIDFFGFSSGSHIDFAYDLTNNGVDNPHLQVYNVYDGAGTGSYQGSIIVEMADGTTHLAAGDYQFF